MATRSGKGRIETEIPVVAFDPIFAGEIERLSGWSAEDLDLLLAKYHVPDHWNGTPCTALLEAIRNRIDLSDKTYKQEFPPIFAALNLKMPNNLIPLLQKVKRRAVKAKKNNNIIDLAQGMPGLSMKFSQEIGPHCQKSGIKPHSLVQEAANPPTQVTNAMIIELYYFRKKEEATWKTVHDKWWPNLFQPDIPPPRLGTLQSNWYNLSKERQTLRKEALQHFLDTVYSVPIPKPPAQNIDTDNDSEEEDDEIDNSDLEFYPDVITEYTVHHMGDCMEYLTDLWQDECFSHQETPKELKAAKKMTRKVSKALDDAKNINTQLKKELSSLQTKNVVRRLERRKEDLEEAAVLQTNKKMDANCPNPLEIKPEPVEDAPEDVCYENQWLFNTAKEETEDNSSVFTLNNNVNMSCRNLSENLQNPNFGSGQKYVESNYQNELEIKTESVEEPPNTVEFGPNWLSYKLKEEKEYNSNDSSPPEHCSVNDCNSQFPSTADSDTNVDEKDINSKREKCTENIFELQATKKSYHCQFCNKVLFGNTSDFKRHSMIHTKEEAYSSNMCDKTFSISSNLNSHLRTRTNAKPYSCNVCNKEYSKSSDLKRHLWKHIKEKPHPCTVCKKAFSTSSELNRHLRIHTKEKPYPCNMCDKAFSESSTLKAHLRIHTKDKPFSCHICEKAFSVSSSLKQHLRTHTNEKPFPCNMCDKAFTVASSLKAHQRVHTNEKPFPCNLCDKAFSVSSSLKKHLRIHTNEKPFPCNVCDKAFSVASSLKKHLRIHTNERPFPCNFCGKAFSVLSSLKAHVRIHTKERPFPCNMCDKTFSVSSSLKKHIRIHTNEKPFPCNVCGKAFSASSNMRSHQKVHTKEKLFPCNGCDKAFPRASHLKKHLKIHRKEKIL